MIFLNIIVVLVFVNYSNGQQQPQVINYCNISSCGRNHTLCKYQVSFFIKIIKLIQKKMKITKYLPVLFFLS